jgi:hypothetical protein
VVFLYFNELLMTWVQFAGLEVGCGVGYVRGHAVDERFRRVLGFGGLLND